MNKIWIEYTYYLNINIFFFLHFELRSDLEQDFFYSAVPDPEPRKKISDPHPCLVCISLHPKYCHVKRVKYTKRSEQSKSQLQSVIRSANLACISSGIIFWTPNFFFQLVGSRKKCKLVSCNSKKDKEKIDIQLISSIFLHIKNIRAECRF